jgi:CubicO group peptidase (beta-lactamase class C family)
MTRVICNPGPVLQGSDVKEKHKHRSISMRGLVAAVVFGAATVMLQGCLAADSDGCRGGGWLQGLCPESAEDDGASAYAPASRPDYWPTGSWQTAPPASHGFPAGSLGDLSAAVSEELPFLTSLLIIRDGYILHESYHTPEGEPTVDAGSKHHVWSITKSVNSLTWAIARQQGDIEESDLSATTGEQFSNLLADMGVDDPRRGITPEHVLHMQSGLDWNEGTDLLNFSEDPLIATDPACAEDIQRILCVYLHRDLAKTPGTVWNYSTYDSYVLSAFFSALTDIRLADYAEQYLFTPLGIGFETGDWPSAPEGSYTYGGGLLFITSRDLARLGQLVLYGGEWDGQQLAHPAWLERSLALIGEGNVMQFDEVSGEPLAQDLQTTVEYAEQWWRDDWTGIESGTVIGARGLGGQYLFIFPEQGLLIVATSYVDSQMSANTPPRTDAVSAFLEANVLSVMQP